MFEIKETQLCQKHTHRAQVQVNKGQNETTFFHPKQHKAHIWPQFKPMVLQALWSNKWATETLQSKIEAVWTIHQHKQEYKLLNWLKSKLANI